MCKVFEILILDSKTAFALYIRNLCIVVLYIIITQTQQRISVANKYSVGIILPYARFLMQVTNYCELQVFKAILKEHGREDVSMTL